MAEEILPGLYRVVVPLPGSPLKELNSYVLTARDRNLVVDTGMNRPECLEALEQGLDEIGVDLERTDFLATHLHHDHHGLIPGLLRDGRRAYMGAIDADAMRVGFRGFAKGSSMSDYLARSGFPSAELEESFRNHPAFKYRSQKTVDYLPLHEGDLVEIGDYRFEVIDTPGHTFGHISLYERSKRVFLAGDHVLGDITPNIQAWSDEHDPLALFLRSLEKVEDLPVEICLPGHRSLIHEHAGRVEELIEHHRQRGNEAIDVLREAPGHAYDTAGRMTWSIRARSWDDFPIMQRWFATGETIAHLRYLEELHLVERGDTDQQILYSWNGKGRL
jgi:glyoxylase-like metal-dependent hydrolase (beta-lactamase superfamily II)